MQTDIGRPDTPVRPRSRHNTPSITKSRTRGLQPLAILLATAAILLSGCSGASRPDPKDTLKEMFDAIRTSDTVALVTTVDLKAAGHDLHAELVESGEDTAVTHEWDKLLLKAMTGEGVLRRRWMTDNQIVLGRSEITGDSASVEVSFLDRVTRIQYYNKMRLHFRGTRWVVTDFKTM